MNCRTHTSLLQLLCKQAAAAVIQQVSSAVVPQVPLRGQVRFDPLEEEATAPV